MHNSRILERDTLSCLITMSHSLYFVGSVSSSSPVSRASSYSREPGNGVMIEK